MFAVLARLVRFTNSSAGKPCDWAGRFLPREYQDYMAERRDHNTNPARDFCW